MSEGNRMGKTADPVMSDAQEEAFVASGRGITVDAIASGLRQLGAQNGVFTTILEADYEEDPASPGAERLKYLIVLADTDLQQGGEGRNTIRELLHKAAKAPKGEQYCRCRIARISPKGQEDPLKLYTEACRAIRETAVLKDVFGAEGYPVPEYLSQRSINAFCHLKEKMGDDTLAGDVRRRYGQCLRQLVQEAHNRDVSG